MANRDYGQACSVANFMDHLGDRWTLLIVRDLLLGPRRFTELLRGLDGIGPNLLSKRLDQLSTLGVIEQAEGATVGHAAYVLTPAGEELESVILAMQRWGTRHLQHAYAGKRHRPELLVVALRAAFRPELAVGIDVRFELRIGEIILHAEIEDGSLTTGLGHASAPDLVLTAGPDDFNDLAFGKLAPKKALATGRIRILGPRMSLGTFMRLFGLGTKARSVALEA